MSLIHLNGQSLQEGIFGFSVKAACFPLTRFLSGNLGPDVQILDVKIQQISSKAAWVWSSLLLLLLLQPLLYLDWIHSV